MKILLACECSGMTRRALAAKGHDVTSIDLLPAEDNSPDHIVGDALTEAYSGKYEMMIAHPPCRFLANSGVRWLGDPENGDIRWGLMKDGARFFADLLRAPIPRIAVENPVMHGYARREIDRLIMDSHHWDPIVTHFTQPWHHGDPYFKATGFTLRGLPPLQPTLKLQPPKRGTPEHKAWSMIHNMSPGKDRAKNRSRTFPGIARAIAEQWS